MEIALNLPRVSAEAAPSGLQVIKQFGNSLRSLPDRSPPFQHFVSLELGLALIHPLVATKPIPPKARFQAASKCMFASADLDYFRWIEESWLGRVDAALDAVVQATEKVASSRLTKVERTGVIDALTAAALHAREQAPVFLEPLKPIYLAYSPGAKTHESVHLDGTPTCQWDTGSRTEEVAPADLVEFLKRMSN